MKHRYYLSFFWILFVISCKNEASETAAKNSESQEIESETNKKFPEDFLGIYKGDLQIITSNGTEVLPMEFHLLGATDGERFGYKIYYGKEREERSYNLERTHNPNLFLIDENNGIVLESGYANQTLFATYEVMGNLLNSTEKFYDDRMEFHITMARVQDTSMTGNESSAIVKNYPLTVIQTAILKKQ